MNTPTYGAKEQDDLMLSLISEISTICLRAEDVDPGGAFKRREECLKMLHKFRQQCWDSLPDKLKREAADQQEPPSKPEPKKRKDKPSQATEAPTDFFP